MIDITPKAVEKIRKTLEANHVEGGFRLGVVGGGCSGLSYKFKLEPQPRATDNIFEYERREGVRRPQELRVPEGHDARLHRIPAGERLRVPQSQRQEKL